METVDITVFSEPWPPWEVFFFCFFLTLRHQCRHQHLMTTASGHQRRQRQGRCCRASGQTARRERVAEGATRVVGARRGLRRPIRPPVWKRDVGPEHGLSGQARGIPSLRSIQDGKEACASAGAASAVGIPTLR